MESMVFADDPIRIGPAAVQAFPDATRALSDVGVRFALGMHLEVLGGLVPHSFERAGPKSVSPALYCSPVAVVVRLKWIVGVCAPLVGGVPACQSRRSGIRSRPQSPGRPTARRPAVSVVPMAVTRGPGFVGRTSERELLDGLLARVRAGDSEVVVIRGEAGIGKTALLRYAARQASGYRVAELTGVEAEMELAFAGIHQLCGTMLDRLGGLPPPQ